MLWLTEYLHKIGNGINEAKLENVLQMRRKTKSHDNMRQAKGKQNGLKIHLSHILPLR